MVSCFCVQKSLLAHQAAQLARLQQLAREAVPGSDPRIMWLVMTSAATRAEMERHMRDDVLPNTPGLAWDQIRFFDQGVMPCFDDGGKFMLATKQQLATAPGW